MGQDPKPAELFVPASTILNVCPQCGKDQYYQERHAKEDAILMKVMTLLVADLQGNDHVSPNRRKMKELLSQFADLVSEEEEAKDVENDARKAVKRLTEIEKELSD